LTEKLRKAELIIEVQKKVAALLGNPLPDVDPEEKLPWFLLALIHRAAIARISPSADQDFCSPFIHTVQRRMLPIQQCPLTIKVPVPSAGEGL